jgi:predicted lysophospholipase L1 biosynthesis ABC-type transport system permease subunit
MDISKNRISQLILAAAVLIPLVGWALGAMVNPSGWMSHDFTLTYVEIYFYMIYCWPIDIAIVLLLMVILAIDNAWSKVYAALVVFAVGIACAVGVYMTASTASESEFTG